MRTEKGEDDVQADRNVAASRSTGGVADPEAEDQASTTGTSPTPEFVGRIAGDDVGYAGETGAERRAEPGLPADADPPEATSTTQST